MKLELLNWNKKSNKLQFMLKDSNDSFTNLIRRYSMDEVPTLAVEDVEFKDNSSALYDEIVALRLGLTPITTDSKSYNFKSDCSCKGEGCAKCQLKITLKSAKKGIVTASEAKSQDPKCTFAFDNMPIVKLGAHQKIDIEAIAVMGRGKEHAKWSPAHVFYNKDVTIKTDGVALNEKQKEQIRKTCGSVVQVDGKLKINKEELLASSHYDACVTSLKDAGADVTDLDNYIITIESWGQLDCKEILEQAADIVVAQLDTFEQQIK